MSVCFCLKRRGMFGNFNRTARPLPPLTHKTSMCCFPCLVDALDADLDAGHTIRYHDLSRREKLAVDALEEEGRALVILKNDDYLLAKATLLTRIRHLFQDVRP